MFADKVLKPAPTQKRIQKKIKVGKINDKYEKEAETISEKIVSGSNREIEISGFSERKNISKRSISFNEDLKRDSVSPDIESRIRSVRFSGKPLERKVKEEFENRFGVSFNDVRVHTGSYADRLNRKLNSDAFTYGSDIFFRSGRYSPETVEGKKLIAHELTHVIQQRGGLSGRRISRSPRKIQRGIWSWIKEKVKRGVEAVRDLGRKVGELALDVKNAILGKAADFAQRIPGFKLLVFLLGKNPITGKPVERSFSTLFEGLISLIPGADAFVKRLRESKMLDRAGSWLYGELKKLNLSWKDIKTLFKKAWESLSLRDISDPAGLIEKLKRIFSPTIIRIKNFALNLVQKIPQFIFETALTLVGAPVKLIIGILNRGKNVLKTIIDNPVVFFRNLVSALRNGFSNFFKNIKKYLLKGLFSWLFGTLEKAGLKLPEKFDLKGFLSIVFQILGLTYEKIRNKLVKRIGEERVKKIEKGFELIQTLRKKGSRGIVELIAGRFEKLLESIKDAVVGSIRNWVVTRIVKEAVLKLMKMWNPVGAVIEAVKNIYRLVMFLHENIKRIAAVVQAVFNSISEITSGKIKKASLWIEKTLGRTVPVVISFFARMLGLGGISKTIKNIIKKVQKRVDTVLDKTVDWIVKKTANLWIVKAGKKAIGETKEFKEALIEKGKSLYERLKMVLKGFLRRKKVVKTPKKRYLIFINEKDRMVYVKSSPARRANGNKTIQEKQEELSQLLNKLSELIKTQSTREEIKESILKSIEKLKDLIQQTIEILFRKIEEKIIEDSKTKEQIPTGKEDKPIPIFWFKDPSFFPKIKNLKEDREADIKKGKVKGEDDNELVLNFKKETNEGKNLLEKGDEVQYTGSKGKGREIQRSVRKKLKELVEKGLIEIKGIPNSKDWQVDHVKDLQWGGEDKVENLWPVDSEINRKFNESRYQNVIFRDEKYNVKIASPGKLVGSYFKVCKVLKPGMEVDIKENIRTCFDSELQKKLKEEMKEGKRND